jgi:hypothetical protein
MSRNGRVLATWDDRRHVAAHPDDWKLVRRQFDYATQWAPEIGKPNTWPDPDMLAIGRLRLAESGGKGEPSKFTSDERRTMMSLRSAMRSALIIGGDLPEAEAFTLSLLTNPEVIAVDQHSRSKPSGFAPVVPCRQVRAMLSWRRCLPPLSRRGLAARPRTLIWKRCRKASKGKS